MARQLYERAAGPKELLTVPGAGHGLSNYVDPEAYYGKVFSFLGISFERFVTFSASESPQEPRSESR